MLIACILLLPLILYVQYKEAAGFRKTKYDLAVLAEKYNWFEWTTLRTRVKQAVKEIANVWATGDLSSVSSFMTSDYFASQQELLRRWLDEGKQIVYRVEKIQRIEPLAVSVDYMRDRHTLEVIKGEVGTTTGFESVWVFVDQNGEWLLSGIEEGSTSFAWAKEKNRIDTSYLDSVWNKKQKVGNAAKASARTGTKSQAASRDSKTNQPIAQPKQRLIPKPTRDEDQ